MNYKCLNQQIFTINEFGICPLRYKDIQKIRIWRNNQLLILRQKHKISSKEQINYYNTIIKPGFKEQNPSQVLFSFTKNKRVIGYGGLVHINWIDKHAEISFLLDDERSVARHFQDDFTNFLYMIEVVAFIHLQMHKIYSYAYDIRKYLYKPLINRKFKEDARLRDHIIINNNYTDVVIHSKLNKVNGQI